MPRSLEPDDVARFLDDIVDGYVLDDLRAMKANGIVGFPMLMTCLAGIELLGYLAREREPLKSDAFKSNCDDFVRFWEQYLYPDRDIESRMGCAVYALFRHGIAHVSTPKGLTAVPGSADGLHLQFDRNGVFYCNPIDVAADRERAYSERFRQRALAVSGAAPNTTTVGLWLDGLMLKYDSDAGQHLDTLWALRPSADVARRHPTVSP